MPGGPKSTTQSQKQHLINVLKSALSDFGTVRVRTWGDVVSVELSIQSKTVFSFQIAARTLRLEDTILAGWINIPLDSLPDLVASKMTALVERGAPRDFLDIFTLCQNGLLSIDECWALWHKRQVLAGIDPDSSRARLAIETHLERISLHRPLEQITDSEQRQQARTLRESTRLHGPNPARFLPKSPAPTARDTTVCFKMPPDNGGTFITPITTPAKVVADCASSARSASPGMLTAPRISARPHPMAPR